MRNETAVDPSRIREEIEGLRHLTTAQLKDKYRLIRRYQGKDIIVHVRADGGFECDGRIYKSLSKAVTEATGTRWNGFAFYNLGHRPGVKRGEQE